VDIHVLAFRGYLALEHSQQGGIAFEQREGRIRFAERVEAHLSWIKT
jgi:hypothetical protein